MLNLSSGTIRNKSGKITKKLSIILAVILLLLLAERLVFTSEGYKVELSPEVLRAYPSSRLELRISPVNVLGFRTPFAGKDFMFKIEDGENLVELAELPGNGSVIVSSKGIEGEAVIGIYSLSSGLPVSKVLIRVLPREAALLNLSGSFKVKCVKGYLENAQQQQ